MSAPKLEDLPKVAVDLKSQLEGFSTDKLKEAHTQEKIVLPTAEGMAFNTIRKYMIPCGVWNVEHCVIIFCCLSISDVASEKTQQNLIHGIVEFDASKLKHAETQEKNPLPDKDGMFII